MTLRTRLALLAAALAGLAALAWWRWGEAAFLAQLGALLC